jgi:hypothetical protein
VVQKRFKKGVEKCTYEHGWVLFQILILNLIYLGCHILLNIEISFGFDYELFADLFESVYNVDTCDSDNEDVSDPSDGCGFSSIRLRMSDLEAAISGLDANKDPEMTAFLLPLLIYHFLPKIFHPNGRILFSFLFSRPVSVKVMMLRIIVVWQYFHALRNCSIMSA